jgi:extracellular factor (EF) 3-hydroxypalmitic acid methyl ester biosynthesis protein
MFHNNHIMSDVLTGNGNGNGSGPGSLQSQKKAVRPPVNTLLSVAGETQVVFSTDGLTLRGMPLRVTRHAIVFELYHAHVTPQLSEILDPFKLILQERTIYSGKAVISNVVNAGAKMVCEVTLNSGSWTEVEFDTNTIGKHGVQGKFEGFIRDWQKFYLVSDEYKVVTADAQTFLSELNLWIDQLEAGIRSAPAADQGKLEAEIAHNLRAPVSLAMRSMFERFEAVAGGIADDLQPIHRALGQRLLHPFLLCAPFINRTFTKPLGYAGDYEMMNMIVRNGLEGRTLFAKLVNSFLLDQAPAHAVRNRVNFLNKVIVAETARLAQQGKKADIFCVACGPAWEAMNFIDQNPLADQAQFCLLDFNEETLKHTADKADLIRKSKHRKTKVTMVKNSVQNLLRAGARDKKPKAEYDLIYCSGLYDYLNDSVCKSLNTYFFDLLKPGGLMVVGNFAPSTPIKNFMGHLLEWFLIYRDSNELAALAPQQVESHDCVIRSEPSGTNFFLEVRKPK